MNIIKEGGIAAGIKQLFIGKPKANPKENLKKAAIFIARHLEINPMNGMAYVPKLLESVKDENGEINTEKLIAELDRLKNLENLAKTNSGKAQINLQEEAKELWNDVDRIAKAVQEEAIESLIKPAIRTDDLLNITMKYEPDTKEWYTATNLATTDQLRRARNNIYTAWAEIYQSPDPYMPKASMLHRKYKDLDFLYSQRLKNEGKIDTKETIEFNDLLEAMEKARTANENEAEKASAKEALPTGTSAPPVTSSGRGETPVPPPFDDAQKNQKIPKGEVGEIW